MNRCYRRRSKCVSNWFMNTSNRYRLMNLMMEIGAAEKIDEDATEVYKSFI